MSCNTHVSLAEKLWLVLSHSTHHCHFHMTSKIPETSVPCSKSAVIKSQPCFLFSISLDSCSFPSLHSCVSHSCTHHLAVFPLALLILLTNALFPDSIYKTLTMYVIRYVQISTLTIVFIVCSTCGHY